MPAFGARCTLPAAAAYDYARPIDVLSDESAEFVYVLELYPFELGAAGELVVGDYPIGGLPFPEESAATALYFATKPWATGPLDAPHNQAFDFRLKGPLAISQTLITGQRFDSLVGADGSITLSNDDGNYDSLLSGYAIDGRRVVVKVGRVSDRYADFVTLFDGTARDWQGTSSAIEILVRDNSYLLETPAQPNIYAGTGDDEGGDELAGKRRPITLGLVEHMPATLVDPALLIYQLNDGAIANDPVVLDKGLALTAGGNDQASYSALAAYTVAAGEFELWPAGGFFKLGSLPDGIVTASGVHGAGIATTSELVNQLLEATPLRAQKIDQDSLTALETLQGASVGIYIGTDDGLSVGDAIGNLLEGIGAFACFDRLGRFYVARIDAPAGDAVDSFNKTDIKSLEREALGAGLSPPPWRIRNAYKRNYEQLTGELAGGVTAADRAYFSQPYLLGSAADPTIITSHALAQDADPIESYFADAGAAAAEAGRLLYLFATNRGLWRMQLPRRAHLLKLGDIVDVSFPRFGLTGGTRMIVLEKAPAINTGDDVDMVEVVAYG